MENEYVHIIVNLIAVLALMIGLIYILRRFKQTKYNNKQGINILHVVPVGTKEKIMLVEVNQSVLLLGATANHIETLYIFDQAETEKSYLNSVTRFSETKQNCEPTLS